MHSLPRALLLLLVTAASATAQGAAPGDGRGAGAPAHASPEGVTFGVRAIPADSPQCRTGAISYIFIDNHSIFDASDSSLPERFDWAYHTANKLHVRTRPGIIRRELLFRAGDCYDPALLDASARLLRGFDFISRADVFGVKQPDGSYHVVVDTQDEWSTDVGIRVAAGQGGSIFRGARVREANLLGYGQTLELFYTHHEVTRDYGALWEDPQLAGSRWDVTTAVGRTRAGTVAHQSLAYPFLGEAGRWATRQSWDRADLFFDYVMGSGQDERHMLVPLREDAFDLALVGRLGRPGSLTLFGAGLAFRNRAFLPSPELTQGGDFEHRVPADSATMARAASQMTARDHVRAVLLLGQRNIYWIQRRGYDSPRGQQDIRQGAEISLALSRSLPNLARDDDFGATVTLYGGFQAGPALVTLRARGDGLRDFSAPPGAAQWQDLFGEGELLSYLRFAAIPWHTLVLRAGGAGGWRTRSPFQLTLGGDDVVRGYDSKAFPGGRRISFTAEDRMYFHWPFPELFDLGATVFGDLGRMWAGDAPFGTASGWKGSLGLGLRAAFPAGGRTTYRADVAIPVGGTVADARFYLSVGEVIGLVRRTLNGQLERSRPQGLSGDLFSFPR
ncbi:MAG TPA: hypothetical protein VF832_16950 [Longimicrobiales bacterium]